MIQFDFLAFDLPDGWSIQAAGASSVLNLVTSGGMRQIVITPGYAPDGQSMQALLEDFVTGHTHDRLLREDLQSPPFSGTSAGGIPFTARHQASRSFEDQWWAMYWVLRPGDYVQAMLALALRPEDYQPLVAQVAALVDSMEARSQPSIHLG
jgi:hypothetical protein